MKQSNTSSPVLLQSAADGGTNEVRVLLQLIQSLLNGLVDGLLDGLTHPIDLVHAPARLNETRRVSFWEQLCKRQCVLKRDGLETSTTNPEGVFLTDSKEAMLHLLSEKEIGGQEGGMHKSTVRRGVLRL